MGGKMGAEGRWLEPAVLLIFLKVLSNCFQWWSLGVGQARIAWLWDIPESPAPEHALSSVAQQSHAPRLEVPQLMAEPSVSVGELLRLGYRSGTFLLLSAVTDPVLCLLCSVPPVWGTPHSFMPSCGKVNKAYKEENMFPSQPFLLHFSKQFFSFIGRFYFSV